MSWEMHPLSERIIAIIGKHRNCGNALKETFSFLREVLEPYNGNPDMTYRYEHTLRVAARGQQIADGEGWNREPLLIACLLHDISYSECKTPDDFNHHQDISAEIAKVFLKNLKIDDKIAQSICRAIEYHARMSTVPDDATAFELSVRDADDLDGYDIMRTYIKGGLIIGGKGNWICGENNAAQIINGCMDQLKQIENSHHRICGTNTAQRLWEEQLLLRKSYFEALLKQMQSTGEMEQSLSSGE